MTDTKSALFQVYLRLRPPPPPSQSQNNLYPTLAPERFLTVEESDHNAVELPTHITLNPPNDNRRRAVEKFAFTKVFEEEAKQLDLFEGTGVLPLVEGVLGPHGGEGRDGLLATLGVTGSGKSHTILGSRTQRGLTQLALDVLFRSLGSNLLDPTSTTSLHATVAASDASESQVMSAQMFLDTMFADANGPSRASSRAPTPMIVRYPSITSQSPISTRRRSKQTSLCALRQLPGRFPSLQGSPDGIRVVGQDNENVDTSFEHSVRDKAQEQDEMERGTKASAFVPSYMQSTFAKAIKFVTKSPFKGESYIPPTPRRNLLQRPSAFPQLPDISNLNVDIDITAEYAILISMYEVYNDRIFDLLTPAIPGKSAKDFRRRPLLYKHTEQSPDRKVVAGLRKIICGSMKEALMVLEAGLHERRVAGTGSNSVSSRSHGFFCVEVKKRRKSRMPGQWGGSALTVVDLAGSERARDAKTAGATLAEAGKINESLMYLGQCLQMQSDLGTSTKPNLVPFRQCKLTELLFSNSFPSASNPQATPSHHLHPSHHHQQQRNPQKAIMIVTADPLGDFNATSQILRYSALAREITVPRIPSVTSTIMAQSTASHYFSPRTAGRSSPTDTERETMEIAALEIARMSEEIDGLRAELNKEQERRMEAEAHLESAQERIIEVEQEIREECYGEMEARLIAEMQSWKLQWESEKERGTEHLDRKLEVMMRGVDVWDEADKENANPAHAQTQDLEEENDRLRREVDLLRREVQGRSPSKSQRLPLRESRIPRDSGLENASRHMGSLSLDDDDTPVKAKTVAVSPMKKVKKLTARKWDLMEEGDLL